MKGLGLISLLTVGFYILNNNKDIVENTFEHFGQGSRAQLSSNREDNNTYSGNESPTAANAYASSGYQSTNNSILSPTTIKQYQQMTNQHNNNNNNNRGASNYNRNEFSLHFQQQFIKYKQQLAQERRKHAQRNLRDTKFTNSVSSKGLLEQMFELLEQIFKIVLSILNLLIGWLF